MLSNDDLKTITLNAKSVRERPDVKTGAQPTLANLAYDVLALIDEISRIRKVHTEEQRRSADRLKDALADKEEYRLRAQAGVITFLTGKGEKEYSKTYATLKAEAERDATDRARFDDEGGASV